MAEAELSEEVRALIDFAEGRMPPREFEAVLYDNPRYEQVLGDAYLSALQANYNVPGGVLSAHATVCQWLVNGGHAIQPTDAYKERFEAVVQAQEEWLGLPLEYLVEHVLPAVDRHSGEALTQALRDEIWSRFLPNGEPPRWLQHPQWPVNGRGPLLFVGELLTHAECSEETVFVFQDDTTGEVQTVVQST